MSLAMMPWFPGDFMRSTRGWSVTAKGVYRELLDAQWDMGGLPPEPTELAETIRASASEWKAGWSKCSLKFPICEDGLRRNARLETHRSKSADLTERRQKGAAKTNAHRYGQRSLSDSESDTLSDSVSERSPSQSALASVSIPSPSKENTHTPLQGLQSRARHAGPNGTAPKASESVCVEKDLPEEIPLAQH